MSDKEEDINRQTGEELRLLYQNTMEEIRFIKRQQWAITNYGLLLLATVAAFYELITDSGSISCGKKSILFAISIGIAVLGTIYQCKFQSSLKYFRNRENKIREKFTKAFRDMIGENPSEYASFSYYLAVIFIPFVTILWIGVFLIYWLLFC